MGETLESIVTQYYKNWECILVDDGSTDYTEELLSFYCERDDRIQYLRRPKNLPKGANTCRNFGFEKSRGEYINWFDDDDIMLSNFIDEKLNKLTTGIDLVICSYYAVDNLLRKKEQVKLEVTSSLFKSYALYELKLITNSIMFRKKILEAIPLYLPGLEYGDETELFLRIFNQDPQPTYSIVNKPLFLYRQHEASKTKQNENPNPAFRYSIIYVALQNFERGIDMRDQEIISFYYTRLISLFFRTLEAGQRANAVYLLNSISTLLWKINKSLSIETFLWGKSFILLGKGSYKIEQRLKRKSLLIQYS